MKKTMLAFSVGLVLLTGCGGKDYNTYLAEANEATKANDANRAVFLYKNALQQNEQGVEARLGLYRIYMATHRYEDAEKELTRIKDKLSSEDANLYQARLFHQTERGNALLDIEKTPSAGGVEIAFYQYYELIKGQNNADELNKLETWSKEQTQNYDFSNLLKALIAYHNHNANKALSLLSKDVSPNNNAFGSEKLLKTQLFLANKDLDNAKKQLALYVKKYPNDYVRQLQYVDMLVNTDDIEKAKPYLTTLTAKFPKNGFIAGLNAISLYKQGKYEAAIDSARVTLLSEPKDVRARLVSAYSFVQLKKPDEALNNLSFIIDQLPPESQEKRLYLQLKMKNNDLTNIADAALSLKNINANDVKLLSAIGLNLVQRGDMASAKKINQEIQSVKTDNEGKSLSGLLSLLLGEKEGIKQLETAFKNDPDSLLIKNNLASAYLAKGLNNEALVLADKWINTEDQNTAGYMLKGVVLLREQHYQDAIKAFNQVLKNNPHDGKANAAKIEALIALKQTALAENVVFGEKDEKNINFLLQHYLSAMNQANLMYQGVEFAWKLVDEVAEKKKMSLNILVASAAYLVNDIHAIQNHLSYLLEDAQEKPSAYYMLLGGAYERSEQPFLALKVYKKWLEKQKDSKIALLGALKMLTALRQFDEGVKLLDTYAVYHNNQTPITLLKANLYLQSQQFDKMNKVYNQLSDDGKASVIGKAIHGVILFTQGSYQDAIDNMLPFYQQSPSIDYLKYIVYSYNNLNESNKANALLLDFVKKHKNGFAYFLLGNNYVTSKQYEKAIESYQSSYQINPNNPLLLNNLAYTYWQQKNYAKAKEVSLSALKIVPNRPEFVDTLANVYLSLNQTDEALKILGKAEKAYPKAMGDQFVLTYISALTKVGKKQDAIKLFDAHKWLNVELQNQAKKKL